MKSLHEVQTITINFYDCNDEIIFVSAKMPQKPNYESLNIGILRENGINFKLRSESKLLTRFYKGDLVICSGDREIIVSYPGDSQIIWESWDVCCRM